jgi:hypothetical protein
MIYDQSLKVLYLCHLFVNDVVHVRAEFVDQSLPLVRFLSVKFLLTLQNLVHPWGLHCSHWMICKEQIVQALNRFFYFKMNLSKLFLTHPIFHFFYSQLRKLAFDFILDLRFCWILNLFKCSDIIKVLKFLQNVHIQFIWISSDVLIKIFKVRISILTFSRFINFT